MPWTPRFHINHEHLREVHLIIPDKCLDEDSSSACNEAFAELIQLAIDRDLFRVIHGQHSEPFAILGAKRPVHLERFAAPLFYRTPRRAFDCLH